MIRSSMAFDRMRVLENCWHAALNAAIDFHVRLA